MDNKEKINKMMREGKISSNQAKLLLDALMESQQRSKKVFQEILTQQKKRETKAWGFFNLWVLAVLFIATCIYIGNIQGHGIS